MRTFKSSNTPVMMIVSFTRYGGLNVLFVKTGEYLIASNDA